MSHMDHGIFQKPPDNPLVVISSGYQEVLENSVVPAIPDQQNTLLKIQLQTKSSRNCSFLFHFEW